MAARLSIVVLVAAGTLACGPLDGSPVDGGGSPPDGGAGGDAGVDAGAGTDGGSRRDGGSSLDGGTGGDGGWSTLEESEPNGGATVDDFDVLPLRTHALGAVQEADDDDIYRVPTVPGRLYSFGLEPRDSSPFEPHLTVMDTGPPAGNDYVKIVRATSGRIEVEVLAMGHSAYFVVVRDQRNVGGGGGVGDPALTYRLWAEELPVSSRLVGPVTFPSTQSSTLAHPGAVDLFSFDGVAWTNVRFDQQASGDLDGRLYVFAEATGDWIARNDNRAMDDTDPLIDAPLTETGAMLLVVENIEEQAIDLGYSLQASMP